MPTRPIDENPFAAPESDLTPERFEPKDVSSAYAATWQRFVALVCDSVLLWVLGLAVAVVISAVALYVVPGGIRINWLGESMTDVMEWLILLPTSVLYYSLQESSAAQGTLGKRAVGIRVTDLEGRRLTFGRSLARAIGRWLSYSALLVGFLIQPFTVRKQALHDLLAGTIVVRG